MENTNIRTTRSSIKKINISLSPKIACRKRPNNYPQLANLKKLKLKSQIEEKQKEAAYSIAYIGDNSGKLTISFKRFSLPKLSPKQISKNYHTNSPQFNIQSSCEYTINKRFRAKALTPIILKPSGLHYRAKKEGNSFLEVMRDY